MKALVTGGMGFIGHAIVKQLLKIGASVIVADNCFDPVCRLVGDGMVGTYFLLPVDVRDMRRQIERIEARPNERDLDLSDVSWVIHCAAHYANARSVAEPLIDIDTNVIGTVEALEFCRQRGIRNFVLASSSIAMTESAKPDVMTPYGVSKFAAEVIAESYAATYKMNVVSPRFFNVYGPGDLPGQWRAAIPNFFRSALRGENITITGTNQARDFTHIDDVIAGILAGMFLVDSEPQSMIEGGREYVYNIAKGESDRVVDVAQTIIDLTNSSSKIDIQPDREWEGIEDRVGDIKRFKSLMPEVYANMLTVRDGLAASLRWYTEACK